MAKDGRPGLPREVRVRFWDGIRAGLGAAGGCGCCRGGRRGRAAVGARGGRGEGERRRVRGRPGSCRGGAGGDRGRAGAEAVVPADRGAAGTGAQRVDGEPGGTGNSVRGSYRAHLAEREALERARRPKPAKLAACGELRAVGTGEAGEELVAGGDQCPAGDRVPGQAGDAGVARDDLPVAVRAGPGSAAPGTGGGTCGPGGRCAGRGARRWPGSKGSWRAW